MSSYVTALIILSKHKCICIFHLIIVSMCNSCMVGTPCAHALHLAFVSLKKSKWGLKMDYYIWSDIHNNDVNVVVQLHTTNKVIIRSRQKLLLVFVWMNYWKCWHLTIEISEISKLEYRNIEISVGRIEISVSEISDPGAGSETGLQIKISKQHYM